jgi:hypothetical protein
LPKQTLPITADRDADAHDGDREWRVLTSAARQCCWLLRIPKSRLATILGCAGLACCGGHASHCLRTFPSRRLVSSLASCCSYTASDDARNSHAQRRRRGSAETRCPDSREGPSDAIESGGRAGAQAVGLRVRERCSAHRFATSFRFVSRDRLCQPSLRPRVRTASTTGPLT